MALNAFDRARHRLTAVYAAQNATKKTALRSRIVETLAKYGATRVTDLDAAHYDAWAGDINALVDEYAT